MLEKIRHLLFKKRRLQVAYWDLVERAEDHLRALDEDNEREWRLSETRVALDPPAGRIGFTRPNGGIVLADIQCAGILGFNAAWSWTWEHPQIDKALQESARKVRDYGERHEMEHLTRTGYRSTEIEAWDLTAVTCLLSRADGARRLPTPGGYLHVVFNNLSGARPQGMLDSERHILPERAV